MAPLDSFYRYSYHHDSYTRYEEVFSVAKHCRLEMDPESCEKFAHALTSSVITRDIPLALKVLTYFCGQKRPRSCFMAGEATLLTSDATDILGQAKAYFKAACVLGHASGCRRFAELSKGETPEDRDSQSKIQDDNIRDWFLAGYQQASHNINNKIKANESNDHDPNHSDRNNNNAQDNVNNNTNNTPSESTPTKTYSIQFQEHEFDDNQEILLNLQQFLQLHKNESESTIAPVDLDELHRKKVDPTSFLQKAARDSIHILSDGEASKVSENWYLRLLSKYQNLTGETNNTVPLERDNVVSKSALQDEAQQQMKNATLFHSKVCSDPSRLDDCFKSSKLFSELYNGSGDNHYLQKSVSGFEFSCQNNHKPSCQALSQLYSSALDFTYAQEPDPIYLHNKNRAKYYAYKTCELDPAECLTFANYLRQENNYPEYMLMVTHACKKGGNNDACQILKMHLADQAKLNGKF